MAGWGSAVAIMGGLVAYLWLASDSIMDELKDQRPQITIKIKPKKRLVKPASREVASIAPPESEPTSEEAPDISNEDSKASLSKVLSKTKTWGT